MKRYKLFFFGDSICNGQGVAIHKGWVTRLAALLETFNGHPVDVINSSVNGRTTRQALESMPYEIQSQQPDFVVVQFGMNDANHWQTDKGLPRVSPQAFIANLEEIVQRAFVFGARCVFVHTNHPTGRTSEPMAGTGICYEDSNRRYNQLIRERFTGLRPDIEFNDIEQHFAQALASGCRLEDLLLPDLLHLSEAGHSLYLECVHPAIVAALRNYLA